MLSRLAKRPREETPVKRTPSSHHLTEKSSELEAEMIVVTDMAANY